MDVFEPGKRSEMMRHIKLVDTKTGKKPLAGCGKPYQAQGAGMGCLDAVGMYIRHPDKMQQLLEQFLGVCA